MIVADTSFLIDHLRPGRRATPVFERAIESGERIAASVLTKVELLAGMRPGEEPALRVLLATLEWVAVDDIIAERAGAFANQYSPAYQGVDPVDYVIAATAELLGAELWTNNVRHFPMFPGLQPPY